MNKKTKSTFRFSHEYYGLGLDKRNSHVTLEIDYEKKEFSILPSVGDSFKFKNNSSEFKMWKAVNICITEAIEFAIKELEL